MYDYFQESYQDKDIKARKKKLKASEITWLVR